MRWHFSYDPTIGLGTFSTHDFLPFNHVNYWVESSYDIWTRWRCRIEDHVQCMQALHFQVISILHDPEPYSVFGSFAIRQVTFHRNFNRL